MPEISIIMPVYNGMPYLQEAVESVLNQSFTEWELLISDDGSNDKSREYLSTISDNRVRIFEQESNLGIFGNLNFLYEAAYSPLTYILCQDDYFLFGGLQSVVESWKEVPESVGFIRFNWSEMENQSDGLRRLGERCIPNLIPSEKSDLYFILFGNIPGNLANVSVKTHLVREAGWFNQSFPYAGDYEFWTRLGRQTNLYITKTNVSFIRRHSGVASVYLNRKGELVSQLYSIIDDLYMRLKNSHSDIVLRLFCNAVYDVHQRDAGIK